MKKTLALSAIALLASISFAAAQTAKPNSPNTEAGAASAAGSGSTKQDMGADKSKGSMTNTTGAGMSGTTGAAPKGTNNDPKNLNAQDKDAKPSTAK